MNKITLVHAFCDKVEILKEPSVYASPGYAYLVPDQSNFMKIAKDRVELERERNEWISKYNNLLNGLNYWKNKAKENE